jgi:hypothetical protein
MNSLVEAIVRHGRSVMTTNDVPGYEITGCMARSADSSCGRATRFRTWAPDCAPSSAARRAVTTLLLAQPQQAVERLPGGPGKRARAQSRRDAFDCNEIANIMSEVAAYGTAVTLSRR